MADPPDAMAGTPGAAGPGPPAQEPDLGESPPTDPEAVRGGLSIAVASGTGTGPTKLAAFDAALRAAGVANFNLLPLSSVIPPGSVVTASAPAEVAGRWGDRLYVVIAQARVDTPNTEAWAGVGWAQDETGRGLFVEHEGHSEASVRRDIADSMASLVEGRGIEMGEAQMLVAGTICDHLPVCALVVAVYRAVGWDSWLMSPRAADTPPLAARPPGGRSHRHAAGVRVFYLAFVGLLIFEGATVGAILWLSRWLGASGAGPWMAWVVFVIGGSALGYYELHSIQSDQKLRDPILRFCWYLQRRLGPVGFLINAMLIGGSPGAAIALKMTNHTRRVSLTFVAAVLFGTVWVPLFAFLWR